ncbi:MAG: S41 family peptidase [Deltaproteobacteria bacterium]|nr:S41 family peptidase [Deltaproteobacteria bacterium]
MNKLLIIFALVLSSTGFAANHRDSKDWKEKPAEKFSDAETNFKATMQKLMEKYVDKSLTQDELYRAAVAGMLASLNQGEEDWNALLSPSDMKEMQIDMSGKVTGIGIEMKFIEETGYGQILRLIPGSVSEKAGLKIDDQILSVDGKKFKNKKFRDLVYAVRGKAGESVVLKVLREDKIMSFNVKREIVPWTPVELEKVNSTTALLSIRFFNEETPRLVEQKINEINAGKYKKLILDLRDNSGGGFDQAVKVTELFLPVGLVVASTKNRDGKVEQFKSTRSLLDPNVQIAILTNKDTFCGAELFTAALKENLKVKIIGETTFGKWNAQSVENLPNKYAIKYTVKEFLSPQGNSFQGKGIKPDIEVSLPQGVESHVLRLKYGMKDRLNSDSQLKAAVELVQSI